jgi:excisionase family DNA binding protein
VRPLLTVQDVAEILRVSTATVYALVARRELMHVRVGNAIRVTIGEVERYLGRDRP